MLKRALLFLFSLLSLATLHILPAHAVLEQGAEMKTMPQALQGKEINQAIKDRRIYLRVPFGGEFPLHYKANGQVDGSGEAVGLGRWFRPSDTGRWWVDGSNLCQQWQTWYNGRVFCFQLQKMEADSIKWLRDDGYSGIARIGN